MRWKTKGKIMKRTLVLVGCLFVGTVWGETVGVSSQTPGSAGGDVVTIGQPGGVRVKPLGGVNSGPKVGYFLYDGTQDGPCPYIDATDLYGKIAPPFVRLHDIEFPFGHNVFFDVHVYMNDTSKGHANYFRAGDAYIDSILAASPHAKIIFRLGESIALDPTFNPYAVKPSDYDRWVAAACEIAAHYIGKYPETTWYFEIWNEAELDRGRQFATAPALLKQVTTAPYSDYCALYVKAARALNQLRTRKGATNMKIGGPSATSNVGCVDQLIGYLESENRKSGGVVPLEFCSYHSYDTIASSQVKLAALFKSKLTASTNYRQAELILDEWNVDYNFKKMARQEGAVKILDFLIALQGSEIDAAAYYDVQFCGMWNCLWYKPYYSSEVAKPTDAELAKISKAALQTFSDGKDPAGAVYDDVIAEKLRPYKDDPLVVLGGFYALKYFRRLYELGKVCPLELGPDVAAVAGCSALAAADGAGNVAFACANTTSGAKAFGLSAAGHWAKEYRVSRARGNATEFKEAVASVGDWQAYDGQTLRLSSGPYEMMLVEFR